MKQSSKLLYAALAYVVVTWFMSCGKDDLFNKELYRYLINITYPIDTLESDHPWTLLRRHWVSVTADINYDGIRELRLYDDDPTLGDATQVLAESDIRSSQTVTLSYDLPQTSHGTVYAALVTSDGPTYYTPFTIGQDSLNFTNRQTRLLNYMPSTARQTFTYLYESCFPTPEDFDYNDIVLRISRYAPRNNNLQITVTLSAAGCKKQVAAAIRLPGVSYEQVNFVNILEGEAFDKGFPYAYTKIDADDNVVKGRHGEAVIRLFEDAHWSLNKTVDELGSVNYEPYNTGKPNPDGTPDSTTTMPVLTRTFNIFLKDGANADSLRLADLDPFIIESNQTIHFEVHTYKYKFEETIWEYMSNDKQGYDDYLAWALVIPDPKFRYPLEEMPIGTHRNGELFGAYGMLHHSFGEWGRNYRTAYDWWMHPNEVLVYGD